MTRTFILLCTGVFAIAYALYELNHYGVYYPDVSNPEAFTGWKAVTELCGCSFCFSEAQSPAGYSAR
ncbi:Uncharacterised protein [Klebsiella pneumoniae]|nr:Uncharacterised protein [Klebsiella pneumoniae]